MRSEEVLSMLPCNSLIAFAVPAKEGSVVLIERSNVELFLFVNSFTIRV